MNKYGIFFICIAVLFCVCSAQSGIPGGKTPVSTNDLTVVQMANWAATQLEGRVFSIYSAATQVVAGVMYHIDMKIVVDHEFKRCKVRVWSQPWVSDTPTLNYSRCVNPYSSVRG